MRVATDLIHSLRRKFNGGISTTVPTLKSQVMGIAGTDGTVTIAIGNEAVARTLTCYAWSDLAQQWFLNGPTVTDHSVTFLPNSRGVFKIEEKARFYVTSDVAVVDAWTDSEVDNANPGS
jgi:hypothetical protein